MTELSVKRMPCKNPRLGYFPLAESPARTMEMNITAKPAQI
jgi:hypothetical protein